MVLFTKLLTGHFVAFGLLKSGAAASECCNNVGSTEFYEEFISRWTSFWNGDYDLLNKIAEPNMVMYTDRTPSQSGNGSDFFPITSAETFGQAVSLFALPFESYYFELIGWAGTHTHVAVRWRLNAVLGNDTIGSTKPGDSVSFNGTDFVFLDECTGRVKQYDLAQDNVSRFHQLGYPAIPV